MTMCLTPDCPIEHRAPRETPGLVMGTDRQEELDENSTAI
jgi:hypothetical protein